MKIIIAGGGEVGFHLAKLLSYESQDITLIDTDKQSLLYADNNLDIQTIRGNATSISVLKEAGVQYADLIISVTSSETTNITISVIAKQLGCKRSIARISNNEFIQNQKDIQFNQIGIDELISPDQLAATEMEHLVTRSAFNDIYEFGNSGLSLVGILLPKEADFAGKSVLEIAKSFPQLNFMPIVIQRKNEQRTIIPRGGTQLLEGDQIYFIVSNEGAKILQKSLGKSLEKFKRIMILGGSVIGIKTAKRLSQNGYDVKLFEINKEKAYELADQLPNVLIINGDGRDGQLLTQENIRCTDVFIAATSDSETNVMACMMAKSKQVKKTIALTQNLDYHGLVQVMGIDTLLNKKILAANAIFKHIRRGNAEKMMNLLNSNAEIYDLVVKKESFAANKTIRELEIPVSAVIGGVIREGKGHIALGNFILKPDDHILLCSLPESLRKVENLFN